MTSGRNTLSSKLPEAPPTLIATSLPSTWAHTMVRDSHWVGLTFPGMMELPGSFSGMMSSPIPLLGPEASQRTSFAIFMREAASVFNAPCALTSASHAAIASNLLGAVTNGSLVRRASSPATRSANRGWVFSPVPTAVPPSASSQRCGSAASTCASP